MALDAAGFRTIMGSFATGVTVVTTDNAGSLHGITVNALTSVSLDPLLVLVCIDRRAQAHEEISRAGSFVVNVLDSSQESVSRCFAARGAPEPGRLRGIPFHRGPEGLPVLDNCLAYLACDLVETLPGGDHAIFLASVRGGRVLRDGLPLLYFRGEYRHMAVARPEGP